MTSDARQPRHDDGANRFYRHVVEILAQAELPFLVGGGYAREAYTGIGSRTKDLDFFVRKEHVLPATVRRGRTTVGPAGKETPQGRIPLEIEFWHASRSHLPV